MSQTDTDAPDESTDTNQTPDKSLTEHVAAMRDRLESLTPEDVAEMDDVDVVELRTEIKTLEDDVEDARKGIVDDELQDRIPVGESLYGLSHIESHRKYIPEDDGAVVARAVSRGIDYTNFVSVNASTVASDFPDLAEIEESSYTYLR